MAATHETLELRREDGILWVTLNRPERLNAMSRGLVRELKALFGGIEDDRETRVVVLRGAGRAFCSGLDLKESAAASESAMGRSVAEGMRLQRDFSEIVMRMRRAPQPVIAAVHGAASGGGFSLALAADVRIAGESARMNAAFIRIGLTGGDLGASYFLPRIVGFSLAAELLFTGNFVDAARAERIGLVSRVVPDADLEGAARELARDMIRNSPLGLQLTKECLRMSIDAGSLEQVVAMEDRQQILCTREESFREGLEPFREKRPPRYGER